MEDIMDFIFSWILTTIAVMFFAVIGLGAPFLLIYCAYMIIITYTYGIYIVLSVAVCAIVSFIIVKSGGGVESEPPRFL